MERWKRVKGMSKRYLFKTSEMVIIRTQLIENL